MENPVRVAVVGLGYMGKLHAQKYSRMDNVQLVAVCDTLSDRSSQCALELGCLSFENYRDLPFSKIDAVSLASDTATHAQIAKDLLKMGVDLLIEKPIASTSEEGMELVQIANEESRILQVGHLERFNPVFVKLKSCLTTPRYFEIKRITPYRGRGVDVDVILDLMIHDIDLLLDLVGQEVTKIDAIGFPVISSSVDLAQVRIEFEGGVVANVSTSRVAAGSERRMRIFQPDEYISVDLMKRHFKRMRKVQNSAALIPIEIEEESFGDADPLKEELISFIASVRSRTGVVVSGFEAVNAILVVEKIKKSIESSIDNFNKQVLKSESVAR